LQGSRIPSIAITAEQYLALLIASVPEVYATSLLQWLSLIDLPISDHDFAAVFDEFKAEELEMCSVLSIDTDRHRLVRPSGTSTEQLSILLHYPPLHNSCRAPGSDAGEDEI